MHFEIIGDVDPNRLYCVGSFTKMLTSFVCLSQFSEHYQLKDILDDEDFFDRICINDEAKKFLVLFQKIIGSKFTLHDICSYYAGLPYTFDLSEKELAKVDAGEPFKHHSILDEADFLERCAENITPVFPARSKFHYSELSIIFLGYITEKIYNLKIESLYQKYIIDKFRLRDSLFSRTLVEQAYQQDLSDKYDYPAIAIASHGYFCYSNGYYTTLNDSKTLLEGLLANDIFKFMTDIEYARAASNRLMNGLTIEIRKKDDDILFGYEGLSFSGCNIFAYSTKQQKGYLTTSDSEEDVYPFIYGQYGYDEFDVVPEHTQVAYKEFLKQQNYHYHVKSIPEQFRGKYHRVKINDKELPLEFLLENHNMEIRNPDMVLFELICLDGTYRILGKDKIHGSKVGLYKAKSGNLYFMFDGNLYRQIKS